MNTDQALRTVFGSPPTTGRSNPGDQHEATQLSETDRKHVAGLMRINHAGEVSAQALYQGQALTARNEDVRKAMEQAAIEENDHLVWCEQRVKELGSQTSVFGPVWYGGSLAIGTLAGIAGDKWSLGFLEETEKQVCKHLDEHLAQLPEDDKRSQAILEQMKVDEAHHATTAMHAGAAKLPKPVKLLMKVTAKVMTKTAYHI